MTAQIRLSRSQLADLEAIRDMGVEAIKQVVEQLQSLAPLPLRPTALHEEVAMALGGDDRKVNAVLRPVFGLYQLVQQRETTVDDVLDGLRAAIETSETTWADADKSAWTDGIEPQLRRLFDSAAIRSVSKALDLAYDYANLYQGARIVTDIRPVFNDDDVDVKIDGAVVSFTLRLHYDSRDGNHTLSIALDEADIHGLVKQCERALKKATVAKEMMTEQAHVNTFISGESDDSDALA